MVESTTFTISGDDGSSDEVVIPESMLTLLSESGEPPATIIGDLALFSCAQRIHSATHHSSGNVPEEVKTAEAETMEQFESRFGSTFADLTGHSH